MGLPRHLTWAMANWDGMQLVTGSRISALDEEFFILRKVMPHTLLSIPSRTGTGLACGHGNPVS